MTTPSAILADLRQIRTRLDNHEVDLVKAGETNALPDGQFVRLKQAHADVARASDAITLAILELEGVR
ncbi:MAG: hypothetical protein WC683_15025 [bacterium]